MQPYRPMTHLGTHVVTNQVPPRGPTNLATDDRPLLEALHREGAGWAEGAVTQFGAELGKPQTVEDGFTANTHPPEHVPFDRYGHRIDAIRFHPAWHRTYALAREHGVHSIAWEAEHPMGGHVAHAALEYLLTQVEPGVCCPLTMTYAAYPVLQAVPDLAATWGPKLLARHHDGAEVPPTDKAALSMGMAMTEKQGGSDVRANTTHARYLHPGEMGSGAEAELTGHKWFCSAPQSDAFLTLAQTDEGLTCFFVPRWRPDGTRNPFWVQRLKDKLGNKSNASSEIEYRGTWARQVGAPGKGVRTIVEMVHHTRLDTTVAAAGLMRAALTMATHHTRHRKAFGRTLSHQPLMRNVLADMAVEVEATTALAFRIARAYDDAAQDPAAALFARFGVAVSKYWANKRTVPLVGEAMECLGGAGYVEETGMPLLYREAPLNGIWEGSGNVIALDVLRALSREPEAATLFLDELEHARGADTRLDAALDRAAAELAHQDHIQFRARRTVASLAMALQGALLVQHGDQAVAEAFLATRLGKDWDGAYGTLPPGHDLDAILSRVLPR